MTHRVMNGDALCGSGRFLLGLEIRVKLVGDEFVVGRGMGYYYQGRRRRVIGNKQHLGTGRMFLCMDAETMKS